MHRSLVSGICLNQRTSTAQQTNVRKVANITDRGKTENHRTRSGNSRLGGIMIKKVPKQEKASIK